MLLEKNKILPKLSGNPVLPEFSRTLLQPLIDYGKISETRYLEFLRIFLQNDANIAKTSSQLYLYQNTAMYKLDKIEKIPQCDLSSHRPDPSC